MRREGYIKKDSPRGIWEITDAGRKWLDDNI
jgi:predicted transcriptional regulator